MAAVHAAAEYTPRAAFGSSGFCNFQIRGVSFVATFVTRCTTTLLPKGPPMGDETVESRRHFLQIAAGAAGAVTAAGLAGCQTAGTASAKKSGGADDEGEEKVTPGEDLMQEHGVLKRLLLVYGEAIRRIESKQDLPPDPLQKAAKLVKTFVEEYHEKQEEDYLFPRFRQSHKLVDLVDVLYQQHIAGRRVTNRIITLSTLSALRDADRSHDLAEAMRQFIRMYNVHEAREDTVLFPAFRDMLTKHEYDALGEQFEKNEHAHFGADGFDLAVDQVTDIEKALGIYELSQFTPTILS
jgi:hemerythrin-like domain-containing protein